MPTLLPTVSARLQALKDQNVHGRTPWTGLVKRSLIELGHELGYRVATSAASAHSVGCTQEADWGEWLYDLVWYKSAMDAALGIERTTAVDLVLESEWNADLDSIALDFDKLMLANAALRVLVFGAYSPTFKLQVIDYCTRAVAGFEHLPPHGEFLVCSFEEGEHGTIDCVQIPRPGA